MGQLSERPFIFQAVSGCGWRTLTNAQAQARAHGAHHGCIKFLTTFRRMPAFRIERSGNHRVVAAFLVEGSNTRLQLGVIT